MIEMIDITGLREDKRPQSSTIVHALLDRLEAAEKNAAHQKALAESALRVAEGWERKCGELRAKIAEMEKQEPVFWWRQCSDETYEGPIHNNSIERVRKQSGAWSPLYALPGAQTQPAPRVPTALLVAVANLVAQMEIVSRVGFVDTPNDKDSCAAFCVAEGTWLELMSAVESLASALAAAGKAAKRHSAQPAPSMPEVTDAMALAFHHALTDGSIGAREVEEIKDALRAALAAAPKPEGE